MNDSTMTDVQAGELSEAPAARGLTVRFLILAAIAALLLFPALRSSGLAGFDDAFFAHEAKEMLRTGDWWNVRLNGEVIYEIPAMLVWMQASSFRLFGISDAAAKLPTIVFGFGTILLMYFLTQEFYGNSWLALFAMLVLESTQFFLKNATHAMTDVPFTFFFTLTLLFYAKGLKRDWYLAVLGLPLGLALLTRSVVAFLALGIIAAHLVLTKRYRLLYSRWLVCGVVLALGVASIWYVSQYRQHGTEYFVSHFQFLHGKAQVKPGTKIRTTVFAYPLALLKYYWPWLPFLVAGLVMIVRAAIKQRDQIALLLIVWVLLVVGPFSLAQTRYPRYILAAFPAFSVLSALALDRWLPVKRRSVFFNVACGVGCVAICLSFLFPPKARSEDIRKLAPIAEANSSPNQRVLMYVFEDGGGEDYLYEFLWYSNRYAQLEPTLDDLTRAIRRSDPATVIIDKRHYQLLLPLILNKAPQVLGRSRDLICFRVP
jgi:4-amino-4-deoxy-L-arabinose transferase-like glycosyltransferase